MNELRPKHNYIMSIDGLRALSIIMVIFFHCNIIRNQTPVHTFFRVLFTTFDSGVNCFFLISGFLITGILLNTKDDKHYYRNFFFRRMLRIFPLYYLILFLAFFILPNFDHPRLEKWALTDPKYYWLFLSNFYIAMKGRFMHGLIDLSWSLSIEEQFYLIWPWIILYVKKINLFYVCIIGILISIISRLVLSLSGATDLAVHLYTFCQLDALLMGSLLALAKKDIITLAPFFKLSKVLTVVSFSFIIFFSYYLTPLSLIISKTFMNFFVAILFMIFLNSTIKKEKTIFKNSLLVSIGKYSYGIYLIHNPVQSLIRHFINKLNLQMMGIVQLLVIQTIFVITVLLVSYMISYIIFHLYEKHFLKLKKKF